MLQLVRSCPQVPNKSSSSECMESRTPGQNRHCGTADIVLASTPVPEVERTKFRHMLDGRHNIWKRSDLGTMIGCSLSPYCASTNTPWLAIEAKRMPTNAIIQSQPGRSRICTVPRPCEGFWWKRPKLLDLFEVGCSHHSPVACKVGPNCTNDVAGGPITRR
jgi:hypothetical protein